jgi:glyoxylase I family protein
MTYRAGSLLVACLAAAMPLWAQSASDPLELKPSHATASVQDLDRAIQWYTEKLGFKVIRHDKSNPDRQVAWLTIPGYRVDLIQLKGSGRQPVPQDRMMAQGWAHIVFAVPDVDRAYAILKARGVVLPEPVATNETLRIRTSHFPDSEGNWLEIYQDLAGSANLKK